MRKKTVSQTVIPLLLLTILTCMSPIQPVRASGLIYIRADGSIDPPTAPILRNGDSYTLTDDIVGSIVIEKNNTIVDGADHTLQGAGVWQTGIDLSGTTNVTISNMKVESFDYGIYLYLSNYDTVSRTSITSTSLEGIYVYSSLYNNIDGNNITTNTGDGIYLFSSSNNSILENNIASNTWGVSSYYSSGNSIFHNNFLSNSKQANIMESAEFWDIGYPSGGNYWSDYAGIDANSDGIGDTPYVIDSSNQDSYPLMQPWQPPDIAVASVTASKNIIGQGFSLNLSVTSTNLGSKVEGFNLTAYVNTTAIQTKYIMLFAGNTTATTFTWNTSGFAKGNYTISAYDWPVLGETDTADNNLTDGLVKVAMIGDVNADGKVEGKDLGWVAWCFGSYPGAPPPLTWDPNCDINNDGKIDGKDLGTVAWYFGTYDP